MENLDSRDFEDLIIKRLEEYFAEMNGVRFLYIKFNLLNPKGISEVVASIATAHPEDLDKFVKGRMSFEIETSKDGEIQIKSVGNIVVDSEI